jgi:catechol 2,3-dioxygenase-like lactoylglutathione lyase family enzyme
MPSLISHVRYVGLGVVDFEAERQFLGGLWSLSEESGDADMAYFAARGSNEPFVLRLHRTSENRTEVFAFATGSVANVDELHASLSQQDVKIVTSPHKIDSYGGGYGFRFFDVDGRLVEISAGVTPRVAEEWSPKAALPNGLSHAVFHTPDVGATVKWYEEHLGMRVSDWLDDFMCFLRGNGAKHHCMAFLKGPATLNHVAFDLENMDEVMRGTGRMFKNGFTPEWGPGRHTAGDNTFAYFRSPAGNMYEYTAELEYVPDDWEPRTFPRSADIIDQWGTGRLSGPAVFPEVKPDAALWCADAP